MHGKLYIVAFLLIALHASPGQTGSDSTSITIVPDGQLTLGENYRAVGLALSRDMSGSLYLLLDNPPQIAVWDNQCSRSKVYPLSNVNLPSDINCSGLQSIFVSDLASQSIFRFSKYLDEKESIDLSAVRSRFELISLCRTKDGIIYALDRIGKEIWNIAMDGSVNLVGGEAVRGGVMDNPVRIRYAERSGQIVVLDGDRLIVSSDYGVYKKELPSYMSDVVAFNILNGEAWIVGDKLSVVDLKSGVLLSSTSLEKLGCSRPRDVLPYDDKTLFIIEDGSSTILRYNILRTPPSTE